MIKRAGVEVMNERTKNVGIAKATIAILKQKHYTNLNGEKVDISASLDAAVDGTILYQNPLPKTDYTTHSPIIEVTNETTANAAARLIALGKDVVALNFASARNQGGGFLSGALAQEEALCRCSGLYACLKKKPIFYNENILCDNNYYTDNIMYSPKVPFFRDEHHFFLDKPFELSIITAPAPNLHGAQEIDKNIVNKILVNRMDKILQVAQSHGHKNIVLGAWGCGAFGNDPADVAELFKSALIVLPAFEHVTFAVYDTREPPVVYETFKEIFR